MQNIVESIEFMKDANNTIIAANFPMREYFKRENNNSMLLGGSIQNDSNRFAELGIPIGLYLEPNRVINQIKSKQNSNSIMDDDMFEKLLNMVSTTKSCSGTKKCSIKKTEKTKKNRK
jgi:hypothetical protein|uniref:Uncharacterized protein n=1 Tax=viral metagenome TaxID=1070528 RepID=A0A6C0JRG9_9ZZZZ